MGLAGHVTYMGDRELHTEFWKGNLRETPFGIHVLRWKD
jgi:hypothetical protein